MKITIHVEGNAGSGKSTALNMLKTLLLSQGFTVDDSTDARLKAESASQGWRPGTRDPHELKNLLGIVSRKPEDF
jgi:energy-coupling factor transporter ATP-binding protein EcfA2